MKVDIYLNAKHVVVDPSEIIYEDNRVSISEEDFGYLLGLIREIEVIDSPHFLDEDTINIIVNDNGYEEEICNGYINNYSEIKEWLRVNHDRLL